MCCFRDFSSVTPASRAHRCPFGNRRGQALVEFVIVSLVLYLLLAAIVTFGHVLYSAQTLQQAADVAARELARTPIAAGVSQEGQPTHEYALEDVLYGDFSGSDSLEEVRRRVFDPRYLVLIEGADGTWHGRATLGELVGELPVVNQQLVPLMITEYLEKDAGGYRRMIRYPGALLEDGLSLSPPEGMPPYSGYLVKVPLVIERNELGVETIDWREVIEEVDTETDDDGAGPNPDPFKLSSPHRGLVALRVNFPYQAAALSGFRPNPEGRFEPNEPYRNVADDEAVVAPVPTDGTLVEPPGEYGPYAGRYGLGRQQALVRELRPYRRLISVQAIARREVFRPVEVPEPPAP